MVGPPYRVGSGGSRDTLHHFSVKLVGINGYVGLPFHVELLLRDSIGLRFHRIGVDRNASAVLEACVQRLLLAVLFRSHRLIFTLGLNFLQLQAPLKSFRRARRPDRDFVDLIRR